MLPSTRKDDLTLISGISPAVSRKLYALNITGYDQLAGITSEQIDTLHRRHFRDRDINKQDWVGQAERLMKADDLVN